MKAFTGSAVAALALMLAGCGSDDGAANGQVADQNFQVEQIAAPNGDWSQTVTQTPQGGFLMGNPNAKVKVVEFGSMTCPHCAAFSEEGEPKLVDKYVKSGQVSFEFRNFIRDSADLAASLLARCNGPAAFFPLTEQLFAGQEEWIGKAQSLSPEQQQQLSASPQPAVAFGQALGLDQFVRVRGVPAAKAQACLADQAQVQRLVQGTDSAVKEFEISGTPSFVINGKLAEASDWKALEPLVQAALR
jgi:protein-disulfide isomerase